MNKNKLFSIISIWIIVIILLFCTTACSSDKSVNSQITSEIFSSEATNNNANNTTAAEKTTDKTTSKENSEKITSAKENATKNNNKKSKENKKATTTKKKIKESTTSIAQKTAQTETATTSTTALPTQNSNNITLTIECTSILSNMDELKEGHQNYVPKDGYILSTKSMEYNDGDTVYDVLSRVCSDNKIKLTSTKSTYGYYVTGIAEIDEKDCGKTSGWTYKVNGKSPSKSCSKYAVSNGDDILFSYVCKY